MSRLTRLLAGVGLAGIVGAAAVLERRRSKRPATYEPAEAPSRQPPAHPSRAEDDQHPPRPLLSPRWFVLSHFGMLGLLTLMAVAGLSLRGMHRYPPDPNWHVPGGDAQRGHVALNRYGCGGCHTIGGIRGAAGRVGPPLEGFSARMYIGGQLANTPENLVAWLQDPQHHAPGTAMPNLQVSEQAARDMAAYLYAHSR